MQSLCGFGFAGFEYFLPKYERVYYAYSMATRNGEYVPARRQGQRLLDAVMSLGLVLAWRGCGIT